MHKQNNSDPSLIKRKVQLSHFLSEEEQNSIIQFVGDNADLIASGVCQLLQERSEKWSLLRLGVFCFIRDYDNRTASLSLLDPKDGVPAHVLWWMSVSRKFVTSKQNSNLVTFETEDGLFGLNFADSAEAEEFHMEVLGLKKLEVIAPSSESQDKKGGIFKRLFGKKKKSKTSEPFNWKLCQFPLPPPPPSFSLPSPPIPPHKKASGPQSPDPGPISSSNSNDSGVVSSVNPEENSFTPLPRPALLPPSPISPKNQIFTSIDRPEGLQNHSTLVPNTPSPSTFKTLVPPSPIPPKTPKIKVEEDGLEAFYPGDITFIKHLQTGGQGSVDLVSTKFYRHVALKKFDQRVGQWEAAVTREELSTLLKTITHPNIVHTRGVLFASSEEKDAPMGILMEYMDGGSVFDVIYNPSSEYSITSALNWCREAASALSFLHRQNLLHRDVKPGNMLLCDGGKKLKISDFGLCTRANSEMTADVGTVVYMAPEVITIYSQRATYDEKCDVYSLGISLWEMIHRRPPYRGVTILTLMNAVRIGARPQIDTNLCSPQIVQLIERMWVGKPKDRLGMEEVHGELEKILDSLGFFEN